MRYKLLLFIIALSFVTTFAKGDRQSTSLRVSELSQTPFVVGALKITLVDLNRGRKFWNGYVELQIENTSSEFATFYPQRLSFVRDDKMQVDVEDAHTADSCQHLHEQRIAPGARIKRTYGLNEQVTLPASIIYDDQFLAAITK